MRFHPRRQSDMVQILDSESLIDALERAFAQQRGDELARYITRLRRLIKVPPIVAEADTFETFRSRVVEWADRADAILDEIDAAMRELRWQSSIGAQSAT